MMTLVTRECSQLKVSAMTLALSVAFVAIIATMSYYGKDHISVAATRL